MACRTGKEIQVACRISTDYIRNEYKGGNGDTIPNRFTDDTRVGDRELTKSGGESPHSKELQ
jgi:hypothetical protein